MNQRAPAGTTHQALAHVAQAGIATVLVLVVQVLGIALAPQVLVQAGTVVLALAILVHQVLGIDYAYKYFSSLFRSVLVLVVGIGNNVHDVFDG